MGMAAAKKEAAWEKYLTAHLSLCTLKAFLPVKRFVLIVAL